MKKIFLILFILIIFGGGTYLWINRHKYFFQGELEIKEELDEELDSSKENDISDSEEELLDEQNDEMGDENDEGEFDGSDDDENSVEDLDDEGSFLENLQEECQQECSGVVEDDEKEYCLELCGFKESDDNSGQDCNNLEGIEKDSCYKKQAVEKLDVIICNEIEDEFLKENCKNRVLEEILDVKRE